MSISPPYFAVLELPPPSAHHVTAVTKLLGAVKLVSHAAAAGTIAASRRLFLLDMCRDYCKAVE